MVKMFMDYYTQLPFRRKMIDDINGDVRSLIDKRGEWQSHTLEASRLK